MTTKPQAPLRVEAIDVMRGLVMVIMTTDHVSDHFNANHFFGDAAFLYKPGSPIDPAQFITRWFSHLCAPTFVALAGTALAISTESRRAKGQSARSIDMHIAFRGVLLLSFEVLWMSWALLGEWGRTVFQVLYALGMSFLCMPVLRRLGDRALFALGLGLAFGTEALIGIARSAGIGDTLPVALVLSGGMKLGGKLLIGYPFAVWLGIMCLGWTFGRRLLVWRAAGEDVGKRASRVLALCGVVGLVVFAAFRWANGFGNMGLYRYGSDVVQWLHVSKYPPSVTYVGLELGIASLVLAALMRFASPVPRVLAPLRLLGQTALFYYLLHVHLVFAASMVLGHGRFGLASVYIGALVVVVALYPACLWYRGYKSAHPNGWARWI